MEVQLQSPQEDVVSDVKTGLILFTQKEREGGREGEREGGREGGELCYAYALMQTFLTSGQPYPGKERLNLKKKIFIINKSFIAYPKSCYWWFLTIMKDVLAFVILPKIVHRIVDYKAVHTNTSLLLLDEKIELITISNHLPEILASNCLLWNLGYPPVEHTNGGNLNSNRGWVANNRIRTRAWLATCGLVGRSGNSGPSKIFPWERLSMGSQCLHWSRDITQIAATMLLKIKKYPLQQQLNCAWIWTSTCLRHSPCA